MKETLERMLVLLEDIHNMLSHWQPEAQLVERVHVIEPAPRAENVYGMTPDQMAERAKFNEEHAAELFPDLFYGFEDRCLKGETGHNPDSGLPDDKLAWRDSTYRPVTFTAYGWIVQDG